MTRRIWLGLLVALTAWSEDFSRDEIRGLTKDRMALAGRITVVGFLSARCPISNAYGNRLVALFREFHPRGVRFLLVDSNSNESAEELARHVREHAFPFPVWHDPQSAAARLFGAQLTPEVFLLDRAGSVRYHGAIDDSQNPARVRRSGLRNAIEELAAGRDVSVTEIRAFGCTIKMPRMAPLDEHGYAALVESHRGRRLLVDFWATWCEPCRREMPPLVQLLRRAAPELDLVTVSTDEPQDRPRAMAFLDSLHVPGQAFARDAETDADSFIRAVDPHWSGALPALFLYDRSTRLLRRFDGDSPVSDLEAAFDLRP